MRLQAELAVATSELASLKEQLLERQAQEISLQACLPSYQTSLEVGQTCVLQILATKASCQSWYLCG